MKEILDYVFQYGIGTVCVIYMIYFQNTTMKEILNTLNGINTRLSIIEDKMENKAKKKVDKSGV